MFNETVPIKYSIFLFHVLFKVNLTWLKKSTKLSGELQNFFSNKYK
jgi:hypothetical protein